MDEESIWNILMRSSREGGWFGRKGGGFLLPHQATGLLVEFSGLWWDDAVNTGAFYFDPGMEYR